MQRQSLLEKLRDIFRAYGYDGASLKIISQETGITRSSLYHYFPDGKEQMASEALQLVYDVFDKGLQEILARDNHARDKATELADMLKNYYQQGYLGCILPSLALTAQSGSFRQLSEKLLIIWRDAMIMIAEQAGMLKTPAVDNANQIICLVEGSLLVVRVTDSNELFLNIIRKIPGMLVPSA